MASAPVYTPEDAQVGYGADVTYRLKPVGNAAAGTYDEVTTLVSVEGPNPTRDTVDVTRLKDQKKRNAPLRPNAEEIGLNIQHVGTDAACQLFKAHGQLQRPPSIDWLLTYPDGETDQFYGFVKGYETSGIEGDTVIMAKVTISVTSVITTTAPTVAS